VYGTGDEAVSATSVEAATRLLTEAGVVHEVVAIDGADHTFMRYEWEREAIYRTVDWLCHALTLQP
jgi:dienelactone hydrolase